MRAVSTITIMGSHPPFINNGRAIAMLMPVHINLQGVAMRVLREHVLYHISGDPSASLILSWIRDNFSPRFPHERSGSHDESTFRRVLAPVMDVSAHIRARLPLA
jgi:hypothetical protein